MFDNRKIINFVLHRVFFFLEIYVVTDVVNYDNKHLGLQCYWANY